MSKINYLSDIELEENKSRFLKLLRSTSRPNIDKLAEHLERTDFFVAPASTNFHSNFIGGLCRHTLKVYDNLVELNEAKSLGINKETVIITSLLHDLCKVNSYKTEELFTKVTGSNKWYTYTGYKFTDNYGLGHSETSIMLTQKFIQLTFEEMAMIRWHMGTFNLNQTDMKSYNTARSLYKGVSALHLADNIASDLDENIVKLRPETLEDL